MHIKTNEDEGMLWHNRLGHPSSTTFKKLISINDRLVNDRVVCPLSKKTSLPFPMSTTRSSSVFESIHIDVWGPHKISSHVGFKYFLTIVDDYSRITWLYFLRVKFYVVTVLKSFIQMVKTQFYHYVKNVRSDNGCKFFNIECKDLFASLGIVHQCSCPHTPQENGLVERKHRHVLEVTRSILFQGGWPIRF